MPNCLLAAVTKCCFSVCMFVCGLLSLSVLRAILKKFLQSRYQFHNSVAQLNVVVRQFNNLTIYKCGHIFFAECGHCVRLYCKEFWSKVTNKSEADISFLLAMVNIIATGKSKHNFTKHVFSNAYLWELL